MTRRFAIALLTAATTLGSWAAAPDSEAATRHNSHSRHNWTRVAHCESTNRWHINTGNGYYGGLQISRSTWRAYGGRRYAPLPNWASKAQQIKVAEKILRGQGRHAWPTCGRFL